MHADLAAVQASRQGQEGFWRRGQASQQSGQAGDQVMSVMAVTDHALLCGQGGRAAQGVSVGDGRKRLFAGRGVQRIRVSLADAIEAQHILGAGHVVRLGRVVEQSSAGGRPETQGLYRLDQRPGHCRKAGVVVQAEGLGLAIDGDFQGIGPGVELYV